MAVLPVIVSLGGINAAGRTSSFHAFKRLVSDHLSPEEMADTYHDLAQIMGLDSSVGLTPELISSIKTGTLVRRINDELFDVDNVPYQRKIQLTPNDAGMIFTTKKSHLPRVIPEHWKVTDIDDKQVEVVISETVEMLIPDSYKAKVSSGGQLPNGFDPGADYKSRNHPRGLKMTVYGASDAIGSMGIEWQDVLKHIKPDEVSVYAGSALAQADQDSLQGLLQAHMKGGRVSSKQMPLSLAEMPADFINSYIINSVGKTGTNMGACASFLYNLRQGMMDIQSGQSKVAIVGNAEAVLVPEIMEGFRAMSALVEDEQLKKLDASDQVNNARACRPFSTNMGFTMAESAQFAILMDDELALSLGANILGSVADVFVNADANKKSISAPGVGNYLTVAKAAALAKTISGDVNKSFVQAHGTGTPQNRVTESQILNDVAKAFDVKKWPVSAVKSYVGHSLGPAAGDQLMSSLGAWQHHVIPGIKTIDHIADDVHTSNLDILMEHKGFSPEQYETSIINSKGFGGNNATAVIVSPNKTLAMLENKHGQEKLKQHSEKLTTVKENIAAFDKASIAGTMKPIYKFGESVMNENDVKITSTTVSLSEFSTDVDISDHNQYSEYLK